MIDLERYQNPSTIQRVLHTARTVAIVIDPGEEADDFAPLKGESSSEPIIHRRREFSLPEAPESGSIEFDVLTTRSSEVP